MNHIPSLVLAALVFSTLPAAAQDRFALPGERVAIYNVAGEVRVEPGTGPNVVVEVIRAGSDADELRVERASADGWQQLIVRYPSNRIVYPTKGVLGRFSRTEFSINDDGTFGRANLDPALGVERINKNNRSERGGSRVRVAGGGDGMEAHADLRVTVPAGHALAVHLGVGRVIATNVDGDLQVDASSGSVEASGLSGFGRIDTGSGAIALRDAQGDYGLHTGSGRVEAGNVRRGVLLATTGSGAVHLYDLEVSELEARTGSGSVTVNAVNAPAARITTGSGGIRAQRLAAHTFDLNTGSGSVRVELTSDVQIGRIDTGSGGVDVAIAPDAGAEITIDTGSGGIDVQVPGFTVSESRRSFLRGRIGDGNGTLRVSTGSGGVNFRSL